MFKFGASSIQIVRSRHCVNVLTRNRAFGTSSSHKYILSFDQGTTSCRAILYDKKGDIKSVSQKEFPQIFPKAGWVEHDAKEIWSTQLEVAKDVVKKEGLTSENIAAIGITNQRETTVIWDRKTGEPIHNAIVWQDKRTSKYCDELKAKGYAKTIKDKTGLVLDSYFSATKIKWILDNVPGARERAEKGELAYGTIDCWLLWNLTEGTEHKTDVSNASRSMLYNIHILDWDQELLDIFNIPSALLPSVRSSSEVYGHCQLLGAGAEPASGIPIAGIAGDQNAALFGQMCVEPGMVKTTYGTGCFLLMNTGDRPVPSHHNLLTTIAWQREGVTSYALEGSVFIAGAVVQWLRDGLKIIKSSAEVETLASEVPDSDGVYVVPAFAGLGAPYWNQDVRGTIVGLHRGSTGAHIARAAVEGIAFQTMDVLRAMEKDTGRSIDELRVDGGACKNNLLLEFQSEILNATVLRPKVVETTSLGAAYLAGLAVGYWSSIDEIKSIQVIERTFRPSPTTEASSKARLVQEMGWKQAIHSSVAYATKIDDVSV